MLCVHDLYSVHVHVVFWFDWRQCTCILYLSGTAIPYYEVLIQHPIIVVHLNHTLSLSTSSEMGVQTYVTNITKTKLFSREFTRKDFFYCEKCKTFAFTNCSEDTLGNCVDPCSKNEKNNNETECNSTLEMMQAVIYPGDIQGQLANSELWFYFMLSCACAARYTIVCLCVECLINDASKSFYRL